MRLRRFCIGAGLMSMVMLGACDSLDVNALLRDGTLRIDINSQDDDCDDLGDLFDDDCDSDDFFDEDDDDCDLGDLFDGDCDD